ncbi:MAG TPA: hypothetical protein VGL53_16390 [Bryobacteraceae bacterium]
MTVEIPLGHAERAGRRADLEHRIVGKRLDGIPAELQVIGFVFLLSHLSAWVESGGQVHPFGCSGKQERRALTFYK